MSLDAVARLHSGLTIHDEQCRPWLVTGEPFTDPRTGLLTAIARRGEQVWHISEREYGWHEDHRAHYRAPRTGPPVQPRYPNIRRIR